MKPGDFQLSIIDFFAVLVPGTAAAWLVLQHLAPTSFCLLDPGLTASCQNAKPPDITVRWAAFLLVSYVLGHFVFMASSNLDATYDRWRKLAKPISHERCYKQAADLAVKLNPGLIGQFSVLKWARAYLLVKAPAARVEVDALEASQKLFRSLVVVAAASAIHLLVTERSVSGALAACALSALSFQRYCDQRWKMTELAYSTVVIVHASEARTSGPIHE